MNQLFVTAKPPKSYTDLEEILTDYHAGVEFRAYGGQMVSIKDQLRMRMATFTHVCFVWMDKDDKVRAHNLELK